VADSYNTRILKFASDRTFVMAWGGFGTGNVYVADIERGDVQKFDPDGHWLLTFGAPGSGPGQLAGPSYPAVDTEGNLYVAEFRNNRVSTFFITSWGTRGTGAVQFQDVNAVSVDAAGTLCLTDAENSRIQVLDAEGRYRFAWTEAGPGEGFYAASTELDGQGNIYIAYIGNSRVQTFRLLPQPE
jgi:tripartite motif-containing protein 71